MATYGGPTITARSSSITSTSNASGGLFAELMGGQPSPARLKIPQKDLLMFFRQLAVILQSGVPLAQGMILIAENMTNEKLSHCVKRISARLSAGEELSVSQRQYPKVFESLTIGLMMESYKVGQGIRFIRSIRMGIDSGRFIDNNQMFILKQNV